jgi:2-dehydro-3-deoxyphosphogluconate aldolase / (4S)-4-hydroxy-2-oxoglutarate aldolase
MSLITSSRVLGIVRFREPGDIEGVLTAIAEGGIDLLEVTIDTPGALEAVVVSAGLGRAIGVGTVRTGEQVKRCADAGARFVVSPGFDPEVLETAHELGLEVIAGFLTATELMTAERAGCDALKLFPASLGGPAYLRALRGPFPDAAIVPTGGLGLDDVLRYLEAGATCVGLGGRLTGESPPASDRALAAISDAARRASRAAATWLADSNTR